MTSYTALILTLAGTLAAAPVLAQTCHPNIRETTPAARFVVDANKGTVLDKKTGLMWKRCAEGQSGTDCEQGGYSTHVWGDALSRAANSTYAGYKDWRLPNAKELEGLVEEKCYSPSINEAIFPNAPSASHWSGSPYASYFSSDAWIVIFGHGNSNYYDRGNSFAVRLVRGGQ